MYRVEFYSEKNRKWFLFSIQDRISDAISDGLQFANRNDVPTRVVTDFTTVWSDR